MVVGLHIPRALGIDGREPRIQPPDQHVERRVRLGQIAIHNVYAFCGHSAVDLNDEVAAIVGDIGAKKVVACQRLAAKLATKDERVPRIARAQHMLVKERALLVVARVVEAGSIGRKRNAGVARGRQLIFQRLAGGNIQTCVRWSRRRRRSEPHRPATFHRGKHRRCAPRDSGRCLERPDQAGACLFRSSPGVHRSRIAVRRPSRFLKK